MPTVLTHRSYGVVIHTNDHRPAHVHVVGSGCEAVLDLHCPDGPPELRESMGLGVKEVNRIAENVQANLEMLCHSWRMTHGDY